MIQSDNSKRAAGAVEAKALREFYCDKIPLGDNITAVLCGKSWGRSTNLLCYFSEITTGANFTISVFRSRRDGKTYCADDHNVDFSLTGIVGNKYNLNIKKSERAKFANIKSAILVD